MRRYPRNDDPGPFVWTETLTKSSRDSQASGGTRRSLGRVGGREASWPRWRARGHVESGGGDVACYAAATNRRRSLLETTGIAHNECVAPPETRGVGPVVAHPARSVTTPAARARPRAETGDERDRFNPSLTGLRGLAALAIVVAHCLGAQGPPSAWTSSLSSAAI